MIAIIGLFLGLLLGLVLQVDIPSGYSSFFAVMILVSLDAIFTAIKTTQLGRYNNRYFIGEFLVNLVIASFITLIGVQLKISLEYVCYFAFGYRIFRNCNQIYRIMVRKKAKKNEENKNI